MWDDDDFLLGFEKQVKKDIEEYLGLNPEFFTIRTWGYKGRIQSWRTLPHVSWSYQVPTKAGDGYLADYGGWMLMQHNWTDLHRQIMEELGVLADSLVEDIVKAMERADSTWVGKLSQSFPSVLKRTHPSHFTEHQYSWMESHRERIRQQLATLPVVGGENVRNQRSDGALSNYVRGNYFLYRPSPNRDSPEEEVERVAAFNSTDDPF